MPVQYYDTETSGLDTAGIGKVWKKFKRIARKGLKIVSPLLKVVKGIAPMIPGIGTAVGAGLSTAEALASGKSLKDAALAGALGAIPGGAAAQTAAKMGAGMILGGKKRKHFRSARAAIPHGVRAAFDVGACEAAESLMRRGIVPTVVPRVTRRPGDRLGTGPMAQAVRAMRANPGLSPTRVAQKAGMAPGQIAAAMIATKPRRRRQVLLDGRTRAFIAQHAGHLFRRGTGGLDPSGKVWIVQSGDTGSKIAKALTGDANRWPELKAANPEVARRKDPPKGMTKKVGLVIYPGDKLQLPAAWVLQAQETSTAPAASASPAAAGPILANLPGMPTMPTTWTDIPGAPSAPAPDPGVLQSRAELLAWAKTEGTDVAPIPGYGTDPAETGAQWTERDRQMAQTFEILWNKLGAGVNQTDGTGNYNEQLAIALDSWAQMKAQNPAVAITGAPVGDATPVSFPVPTPAVPTATVPTPALPTPTPTAPPPPVAPTPAPPATTLPPAIPGPGSPMPVPVSAPAPSSDTGSDWVPIGIGVAVVATLALAGK